MEALTSAPSQLPPPPDEALVEHALRLLATADVSSPQVAARAHERLATWRERSSVHRAAHAEALRRWEALTGAAAGLREQWPDPIAAPRHERSASPARRRILGLALTGVGIAGLAGGSAWWQWRLRQPMFAQSWRTRTAELLRVTLPDTLPANSPASSRATELLLSAQTALRAVLYRDRRELELTVGEARFDVGADATRPFIVYTRSGRVEVVGTAFTVADRGGVLTVAVERGQVHVYPGEGRAPPVAPPIELAAGDVISLRDGEPPGRVRRVDAADVGAWRSGWLVFDDTPLAEALPAINAFRRAPLVLAEGNAGVRTGRLRLTARFKATDENGLLAALPAALPLHMEPRADGSVVLRERP